MRYVGPSGSSRCHRLLIDVILVNLGSLDQVALGGSVRVGSDVLRAVFSIERALLGITMGGLVARSEVASRCHRRGYPVVVRV
jgi:hypothetical protein